MFFSDLLRLLHVILFVGCMCYCLFSDLLDSGQTIDSAGLVQAGSGGGVAGVSTTEQAGVSQVRGSRQPGTGQASARYVAAVSQVLGRKSCFTA